MRLRRIGPDSILETTAADDAQWSVWDGLPSAPVPRVVIRAARASDLAAEQQPRQVA